MSIFFFATEAWLWEITKRCYEFWFISIFKQYFPGNYRFDLFNQDPNWSLWSGDKLVEEIVVDCVPCIRILIVPEFESWIWWWFNTIVNLDVLCSYWFSFSNQRVNRKSTVKEENSIEKFFILSLASKSICPKTHWRFLVLNHLHLQNHVSLQLEACSLPSRPQWKVFNFRQTFTLKSCRICFWQQKPDSLNIPKAELNLIYLYMQAQFSAQLQVWFVAWRSQSIFSAVVTSQSNKK